jgi:integrase
MPSFLPKEPPPQEPHIYSHAELRDLLEAASRQKESWLIEPTTMRTLLLLLYGAALRAGESIRLALADVDIDQRLLVIRDTKFHKSRLVPLGTHLLGAINIYKKSRVQRFDVGPNAPFLITRRGHALNLQLAESNFVRLYGSIGMRRSKGNHYGPRLHDFRHTFAVHRLIRWYREGADVQRMLPHLSTYLGHVELRDTQRYLTMIPELLSEASLRFEKYTFTRKKAL